MIGSDETTDFIRKWADALMKGIWNQFYPWRKMILK